MPEDPARTFAPGFTKLIVENMDAMSKFYCSLCGFEEEGRAEDKIAGRPIREVYFRSDPPGTGSFTLTKFLDAPRPKADTLILGFIAADIGNFVETAVEAGAVVVEPVQSRPEHRAKVAFVRVIEDNLIEVVELL